MRTPSYNPYEPSADSDSTTEALPDGWTKVGLLGIFLLGAGVALIGLARLLASLDSMYP